MVLYYNDIGFTNNINEFLIPLILFTILLMPYLLYKSSTSKKYYYIAFCLAFIVMLIQILALIKNFGKYPL